MGRAFATSICLVALGCATAKPLVRSAPGGGYLCDTTGLSYAFCQGDPDFTIIDGYAILNEDRELLGAIIGLENGTVVPVDKGEGMKLIGPIDYRSGDAEDLLMRADTNRDFAVNTEELRTVLSKALKKMYPDVFQQSF